MKMENEIVAPKDGRIGVLKAVKGSTVKAGDVLLTVI
jgi:biotin carboxyl carrier protein